MVWRLFFEKINLQVTTDDATNKLNCLQNMIKIFLFENVLVEVITLVRPVMILIFN